MDIDPPFHETYKTLFKESRVKAKDHQKKLFNKVEECELPIIDINRLNFGYLERDKCLKEMVEAASQWGFFQVVNHGVPMEVMESLKFEVMKVFHQPFNKKVDESFLNVLANSYRWGNPKAACVSQFCWSEAIHISLTDVSKMTEYKNLRSTIEAFANTTSLIAENLAEVLAENLGIHSSFFRENCSTNTSYLRMNRYPPCSISSEVHGMLPHTDSGFLTILYQDHIGGLQFMKDGRWLSVRPKPETLTISIGDLFQAFSNDVYRSIEHRVVAPQEVERFSVAYFYCPSYDAVIESNIKPVRYRKFSFREYRQQIQKDVQATGDKIGLSRFLL